MPEYYTYYLIFHGDYSEPYEPIIKLIPGEKPGSKDTMHLLDPNLTPILPAIAFVLQLPRLSLDLYSLPEDIIDKAYDEPHNICLIPDSGWDQMMDVGLLSRMRPVMVIAAENCSDQVKRQVESLPGDILKFSVNELDEACLNYCWRYLQNRERIRKDESLELLIEERHYLLKGKNILAASAFFLTSQYGKLSELYQEIFNSTDVEESVFRKLWNVQLHQDVLMEMRKRPDVETLRVSPEKFRSAQKECWEKLYQQECVNVVITVPGIPKVQIDRGGLSAVLPEEEKETLRLMAVHRAVAENAALIELPCLTSQYYQVLNELEISCQSANNGAYVWRMLRKLGEEHGKQFTENQRMILGRAKHISIFSNAPIGLGILPGTTMPLHSLKPVSSHSITPFGRTLPMEMIKNKQFLLHKKCTILFAECVPDTAENRWILRQSATVVQTLERFDRENPNFMFRYRRCENVEGLKQFLRENRDAEGLIISAHGFYMRERNIAGLVIGTEHWMADEKEMALPPLVMLSACMTVPRGSGCVHVADLLLRMGAVAVLANAIPVNAGRNAIILTRFFTYLIEAQKGSRQYRNVLEAWTGVTAGNAIHEIMYASSQLTKWMYGKNERGELRLMDFELNRANRRMRFGHAYEDTVQILKKMLAEEGMEGKFDSILNTEGYFPESLFYQFLGYPENLLLADL